MKWSSLPTFVVNYLRVLNRKAIRWRFSPPWIEHSARKFGHDKNSHGDLTYDSRRNGCTSVELTMCFLRRRHRRDVAALAAFLVSLSIVVFIFYANGPISAKDGLIGKGFRRSVWNSFTSSSSLLFTSGVSRHQRQLASAQGMTGGQQEDVPHLTTSTSTASSSSVQASSESNPYTDDYEDDYQSAQNSPRQKVRRRAYFYPKCGCYREITVEDGNLDDDALSTCDGFATLRGRNQKVVSFSFYGNSSTSPYLAGIKANAEKLGELYPGWTMRVYHNVDWGDIYGSNEVPAGNSTGDSKDELRSAFCDIVCQYDSVDMCDVRSLHALGDVSDSFGMLWRFLVLGDPTVETFVVRDLDSVISHREAHAVQDWLSSGHRFHVMRDSPMHNALFLGGLWGAHNYHPKNRLITPSQLDAEDNAIFDYDYSPQPQQVIRDDATNDYEAHAREWRDRMLLAADGLSYKGLDQHVLNEILGPAVASSSSLRNADSRESSLNDLISHDSYTCRNFPDSKSWPTRRKGREFVGSPRMLYPEVRIMRPCPVECRPDGHNDWLFC